MHLDTAAGEFLGPYGLDEPLAFGLDPPQAASATARLAAVAAIDQVRKWSWFVAIDMPSACSARSHTMECF
jgi:hypothetical protein